MGFKLRQNPSGLEMVNEFMKRMKSTTEEAKSTICKAQEDGGHDAVLQLKKVSGPCIQTRRLGIPRHVGYQNDMFISKVITSQTGTLQNRTPSGTISLPSQVVSWNETVTPSVQHDKVVCHSRRSDTRKEATSPTAIYCH